MESSTSNDSLMAPRSYISIEIPISLFHMSFDVLNTVKKSPVSCVNFIVDFIDLLSIGSTSLAFDLKRTDTLVEAFHTPSYLCMGPSYRYISAHMTDTIGKGILYEDDDERIKLTDQDDSQVIKEYRMYLIGKVLNPMK
ncbi:hypothetical protein Bca52824_069314 [Brassica carinata]|uniref:Uncharacterized protein n=1 Tax=Brassica carinata TaxID=52824 RepID=A0A8X7Q2B0_BRACI|nr:hypothetical protein Bca52824_069314 [Brassica carinata]